MTWKSVTICAALLISMGLANSPGITSIDIQYTYRLPQPFHGNLSLGFIDTISNSTINNLLAQARESPYVSYDDEFSSLISGPPRLLVDNGPPQFAYETGIWLYEHNQVWFSSHVEDPPASSYLSILDLETNEFFQPNLTSTVPGLLPLQNPNGGYYFNGKVYQAISGSNTTGGGVVAIDPVSFSVTEVVNSYFGLPLASIDDVSWAKYVNGSTSCNTPGKTHMFFSMSDFSSPSFGFSHYLPGLLPNAYWRFTPESGILRPVIPRDEVQLPNGVAVDPTFTYLYVTDFTPTSSYGPGDRSVGSPAIYRYDLDSDCMPRNRIFFGLPRSGSADGIKIDDQGRVWTGEYEGIVIRNKEGRPSRIEVLSTRSNPCIC